MKNRLIAGLMAGFFVLGGTAVAAPIEASNPAPGDAGVVRATLANGMQVVILPNALAPVVTTVISYDVGSNDDPAPGTAHATEHMLFRGTRDVSAGQLADMAARAGAEYDAETTNVNTKFYFNIPSSYVGLILRLEADRMTGAMISPDAWKTERGAIEQEIRAHESVPGWSIGVKVRQAMFGSTPYAADAGGTIPSFEKMTAADIAAFYKTWYHPNDATLVVAGNVDPAAVLAQIHAFFDPILSQPLPVRAGIVATPVTAATIDAGVAELPVPVVGMAYRFPSLTDPDFGASEVLITALNNGRGAFADLTAKGALLGGFAVSSSFRELGIGEIVAVGTPETAPVDVKKLVDTALGGYLATGVPPELIAAAKTRLLSAHSYRQASISGLANAWSTALTYGEGSPDEDDIEIARTTADDVNRVMRTYMDSKNEITILLAPKKTMSIAKVDPKAGVENVKYTSDVHEPLPAWSLAYFRAPLEAPHDTDFKVSRLSNGLTYTVRRATISPVIVLRGAIETSPDLYQPLGKDGVDGITQGLMGYGTTTYDRKAYTAQLDAVAGTVSLGTSFGLTIPAASFDEGVRLLADGMLHPAFAQASFDVVKADELRTVAATASQPSTLAAIAQTNALYPPGDPRRRRATERTISAVDLGDVRRWYSFSFRPDIADISIVGDVTPGLARATLQKYFGAWKRQGKAPNFKYPAIAQSAAKDVTVTSSTSEQSSVTLTQRLALHTDRYADRIALELANTILSGQGTGSMLFRDVRTAKGYVYSIDSSVDVGRTDSTFSISFAADPKNVRKAQAETEAVIRHLQAQPLPLEDVQRAKALLLAQQVLPLASYEGVASDMLVDMQVGYTGSASAYYWKALLGTTPAQIQKAMRRWINVKRFTRVEVAPGT